MLVTLPDADTQMREIVQRYFFQLFNFLPTACYNLKGKKKGKNPNSKLATKL
jgi:hypothetical protein